MTGFPANQERSSIRRTLALAIGCAAVLATGCDSSDDIENEFTLTYTAPPASGFAAGEREVESLLPVVSRDLTLRNGVTVNGLVTDGTGTPLPGVDVCFVSRMTGMILDQALTDGGGNYSVQLKRGTYDIVVESGVLALGDLNLPKMSFMGAGPLQQDLAFADTVNVTGSIFEELGAAIPGALLEFIGQQTGAVVNVTADGLGAFNAALVPDVYDVVVTPVGGAAATQLKERFTTTVAAAGLTDFTLTEGVTVSGFVEDNFGAPLLEQSEVEALLAAGSDFFAPPSVMVDPVDGSYSIGPLPPGSVDFRIKPPGDTGFPVQDFTVPVLGGVPQLEDFPLLAGFVLSGTILQEGGITPEELVNILPVPTDGALPPLNVLTDAAGFYAVSMFPGNYDVDFMPDVTNLQLPEGQNLDFLADTNLDLTLTQGALLTGLVTQPGGVFPAEDILVSIPGVLGAESITDAAGAYSILAPIGTHDLDFEALDGTLEDFALDDLLGVDVLGATNLDVELFYAILGTTIVQGKVYEPDGVTPAVGAVITATDNDTGAVLGKSISVAGGDYLLIVP